MMQTALLAVAGMDHEGCADEVDALLGEIPGVREVRVSLLDAQVSLQLDEQLVSPQAVARTLEAAGYPASYTEAPARRGQCATCCGGGCGADEAGGKAHGARH